MSATIVLFEPKSSLPRHFLLQHLVLSVLIAIWAIMLLLIALTAHFDVPIILFDEQELVVPF